jgi:hypothetical protein
VEDACAIAKKFGFYAEVRLLLFDLLGSFQKGDEIEFSISPTTVGSMLA